MVTLWNKDIVKYYLDERKRQDIIISDTHDFLNMLYSIIFEVNQLSFFDDKRDKIKFLNYDLGLSVYIK